MSTEQTPLRIVELTIENVKRLVAIHITPDYLVVHKPK